MNIGVCDVNNGHDDLTVPAILVPAGEDASGAIHEYLSDPVRLSVTIKRRLSGEAGEASGPADQGTDSPVE